MKKDLKACIIKGSVWGAAFIASLGLTAFGLVAGIENASNTEFDEIQEACITEYMTSDEFVARVEAKHDELFDKVESGEISTQEYLYEYSEMFDKMDAIMALSKRDDELGAKYREAVKNGNEDVRDCILGAFALSFGIVAAACSGANMLGYGVAIKNELGSGYADSRRKKCDEKPCLNYEYSDPNKTKAQEEAEREEKDFEEYIQRHLYVPGNIESSNPMTIQAMHELREQARREALSDQAEAESMEYYDDGNQM